MTKTRHPESGFAMLIVFVFAATIAITLYTQVPRYAFEAHRQKEELLVERGQQYQRAIQLYVRKQKKYPATLDDLEKTTNVRYLRRRYKDPMTNSDEWRLIHITGGQLTDSLVKKPGANDPNKSTYQNTFITEGPSFSGTSTNPNQPRVAPGGPLRQSDLQGAPGQMPVPGAPTGQQFGGNVNPGMAYQPSQPGQPQYPYPSQVQQYPNQQYQAPAYPGQVNPATGATQPVPLFPLVPGQQTIAGQPLPQQPYQPYMPGQQGYNPQSYPGAVQPNTGFGQPPPVPTYPTSAANSQNSNFGSPFSGPNQGPNNFGPNQGPGQPQLGNSGGMLGNAANLINDLLTKPRAGGFPGAMGTGGQMMGTGIAGVASKYEGEGIKLYNESNLIQEWEFVYDPAKDKANNPAATTPGQPNTNPLDPPRMPMPQQQ